MPKDPGLQFIPLLTFSLLSCYIFVFRPSILACQIVTDKISWQRAARAGELFRRTCRLGTYVTLIPTSAGPLIRHQNMGNSLNCFSVRDL